MLQELKHLYINEESDVHAKINQEMLEKYSADRQKRTENFLAHVLTKNDIHSPTEKLSSLSSETCTHFTTVC